MVLNMESQSAYEDAKTKLHEADVRLDLLQKAMVSMEENRKELTERLTQTSSQKEKKEIGTQIISHEESLKIAEEQIAGFVDMVNTESELLEKTMAAILEELGTDEKPN